MLRIALNMSDVDDFFFCVLIASAYNCAHYNNLSSFVATVKDCYRTVTAYM